MEFDDSKRELLLKAMAAAATLAAVSQVGTAQQTAPPTGTGAPPTAPSIDQQAKSVVDAVRTHLRQMSDSAGSSSSSQSQSTPLYARDANTWTQIQNRATLYLSLGKSRLETAFRFVAKDEDLAFRMQNCELLLDQMAGLLERGLAVRAAWSDLHASAFNVKIQLQNYFDLDAIHQEETVSGFYDHTPREAELQAAADFLAKMALEGQAQALENIDAGWYSNVQKQASVNYGTLMAWLSHLLDYSTTGQQVTQNQYPNPFNQETASSADHALRATAAEGTTNINLQRWPVRAATRGVIGKLGVIVFSWIHTPCLFARSQRSPVARLP